MFLGVDDGMTHDIKSILPNRHSDMKSAILTDKELKPHTYTKTHSQTK